MTTIKAITKFLADKDIKFSKIDANNFAFGIGGKNFVYNTNLKIGQLGHLMSIITDFNDWTTKNCKEVDEIQKPAKAKKSKIVLDVKELKEQLIDASIVPKVYNGYFFPDFIQNIVRRVNSGANTFLAGISGSGKTECVEKLAELTGNQLLSVDFSVGTNSQELIGKFIVKDGATQFVYGIVPLAMKNGWWLNFNELDYASPEHLAILQGVLTGKDLLIAQNENEIVKPHSNFRIFATANTKGRGTETGYTGTNFLNLAFLDRWSLFEFEYTKHENVIINSILQNKDEKLTKMLIDLFNLLRKESKNGKILNAVFSTRRMKEIASSIAYGESLYDALYYDLIGRFEDSEQDLIKEYVKDIFDNDTYIKRKWHLGDEHFVPPAAPNGPIPSVQNPIIG